MAKSDKQRARELAARVASGAVRIYTLTCITDGGTIDFLDEGPFPVVDGKPIDSWNIHAPSGRRQNLIKQMKKRDDDGFPIWVFAVRDVRGDIAPIAQRIDDKGNPAFDREGNPALEAIGVVDEKGKKGPIPFALPPPVWMMEFAQELPIAFADRRWLAAHNEAKAKRAANHERGASDMAAKFREAEAQKVAKAAAMAPA